MEHKLSIKKSGTKGFSLLELMVILAIVGILAAMAFGYFTGTPRERLKSASRDLVLSLKAAHMGSMERSENWTVEFDTNAPGKYTVKDGKGNAQNVKDLSEYVGISFGSNHGKAGADKGTGDTADGISINGEKITFRADGTCTPQGSVYFKNEKETIAVGVISAAGQIRTWGNFGSGWEK